jgi:hypothetical protein
MFNIKGFRQAKQRFYFPKMMILIIEFSGLLLAKKYNSSNYVHAREIRRTYFTIPCHEKKPENCPTAAFLKTQRNVKSTVQLTFN